MNPKFKIGDEVVVIDGTPCNLQNGSISLIISKLWVPGSNDGFGYMLKGDTRHFYYPHQLEFLNGLHKLKEVFDADTKNKRKI